MNRRLRVAIQISTSTGDHRSSSTGAACKLITGYSRQATARPKETEHMSRLFEWPRASMYTGQRPAIGWCQMTESRKSPRSGACMQGRHLPTPRRMLLASGNVLFSKPKIIIGAIPGRCISKPCPLPLAVRFPAKRKKLSLFNDKIFPAWPRREFSNQPIDYAA
jgi:hypothetical protein